MTMLSGIQSTTSSIPKNFSSSSPTKKTKIPRRIFVSYAHSDSVTVNLILDVLRNSGCKIWDPEGDSIPGTYILQNFIDFGIDKTNTAVLFITKNFLSDSFCTFLANHVIGKYIRSEGRYRVIPVLLENCKLPYYLKSVNCISLWKYKRQINLNNDHAQEYIVRALSRILKAISSPSNSFWKIHRSGSKIITHGGRIIHDVLQFGHKLLSRGRKMGRGVREYMQKERLKRSIPKANKFNPINLLKMAASLKHCLISCRYGSCTFQTYGPEYAKFHEHLQICKFVPVHCKYKGCNVVARRHEMCKHEKKCPFIPMECPNDGCKVKKALCFLDEHMNQCKHSLVPCPLKGCKVSVKVKDFNSHRSVCEFRTVEMDSDSVPVFSKFSCPNKDCEETFHTKQELRMHSTICPYAIITCPNTFCDYKNTMARVERHRSVECHYRDVKCRVCFQVLPMKHLDQHKLTCEAKIKCENCGLQIRSSSKKYHSQHCGKNFKTYSTGEDCRGRRVTTTSTESSASTNCKEGHFTEISHRRVTSAPSRNSNREFEKTSVSTKDTMLTQTHLSKPSRRKRNSSSDTFYEEYYENLTNTKPSDSDLNPTNSSAFQEHNKSSGSPESLEVFRRILRIIDQREDWRHNVLINIIGSYDH